MHYDWFFSLCIFFAQGCELFSECVLIFIVFHFKAPVDCMHVGESYLWPNCFVVIIVCCMSAIFLWKAFCVFLSIRLFRGIHVPYFFLIFCLNCFSYSCTLRDFHLRSFELITNLMLLMSLVEVCLIMSVLILYYIYGG